MDEKKVSGKGENIGGRVEQAAGSITGDKEMEAEGAFHRAKGAVKEKLGEAREALRRNEKSDEPADED